MRELKWYKAPLYILVAPLLLLMPLGKLLVDAIVELADALGMWEE